MGAFSEEDEKLLNENIELRRDLIKSITNKGIAEIKDDSERRFLLDLLKSNDQVTINRAKVKSDDKSNASSANMQTAMADFFKSLGRDRKNKNTLTPDQRELTIPDHIEPEIVEGNMIIGNDNQTYDDFLQRNKTE